LMKMLDLPSEFTTVKARYSLAGDQSMYIDPPPSRKVNVLTAPSPSML